MVVRHFSELIGVVRLRHVWRIDGRRVEGVGKNGGPRRNSVRRKVAELRLHFSESLSKPSGVGGYFDRGERVDDRLRSSSIVRRSIIDKRSVCLDALVYRSLG